ncbi:hypothetical protein BT67DRAFT_274264 [Trichocladium antarcticum]|uniref:Uncharacterized protein n=1 Tax=Trichocladium antarcticum TaxID=1450529 RepID=A0AAN6ZDT2_9PEZI|nr:hypothetical protein BT67DRAFT_274264 [Trichocladium antarcticum]
MLMVALLAQESPTALSATTLSTAWARETSTDALLVKSQTHCARISERRASNANRCLCIHWEMDSGIKRYLILPLSCARE